jgi:hypothetical protein
VQYSKGENGLARGGDVIGRFGLPQFTNRALIRATGTWPPWGATPFEHMPSLML